ncbi:MAG: hypothetical protein ACLGHN_10385 [Bacteriovoracia bacterium]
MIKLIFLLFPLFSFAAPMKTYTFGKMTVSFGEVDGFIVNRSCVKKGCEALTKARKFKGKSVPSELLSGGKNPRAVKCKHLLGGKVIIGTDLKGNEQSFCFFPDESILK